MLSAITSGYVQKEIQQSAYEYQKSIESRERIVVGVNEFVTEEKARIPIHSLDSTLEATQVNALHKVKSERNIGAVREALDRLERLAAGRENLLPAIIRAVETYATVGEISGRLRSVFGEHQDNLAL